MLVNSLVRLTESKKEIDFDFSKSLNHNLNNNITHNMPVDIEESPIAPQESNWKTIQNRNLELIHKNYKFNSTKLLMYFLEEVILYSDQINHHPIINIKDNELVSIKCFTDSMKSITSLDLQLAKQIDAIYKDIDFIKELD